MATLQLGNKTLFTQSGSADPVMSSDVTMPSGSIIQVQYTQYTGFAEMTSALASNDYVLCDGVAGSGTEILNVDITPRYSTSKIWLTVSWCGELQDSWNMMFFIYRGNTALRAAQVGSYRPFGIMPPAVSYGVSENDASTMESCFFQYFDIPNTTNQLTYKVGVSCGISIDRTITTNQTLNKTTGTNQEIGISSITAMEIAA